MAGKLPLHDAAWGMAPFEVAVMLAAAFPASVQVRPCRGWAAESFRKSQLDHLWDPTLQ
jgi:hypothetical protein